MIERRTGAAWIAACACWAACAPPAAMDAGIGGAPLATATIGPQGGALVTSGVRLDVPPGALSITQEIAVTVADAPPPDDVDAASPVYKFTPAGLVFAAPVRVAIDYTGADDVEVYWTALDGAAFAPLDAAAQGGVAVAQTTHFSLGFVGRTVVGGADDAGATLDAGRGDAGATLDAGAVDDAGAVEDAGTVVDAGAIDDAGAVDDAGAIVDAGATMDAGATNDAGTTDADDAGATNDAGTADANDAGATNDAGMTGADDAGLTDADDAGTGSCATNADCGDLVCTDDDVCGACTGPFQCTTPFICDLDAGRCAI